MPVDVSSIVGALGQLQSANAQEAQKKIAAGQRRGAAVGQVAGLVGMGIGAAVGGPAGASLGGAAGHALGSAVTGGPPVSAETMANIGMQAYSMQQQQEQQRIAAEGREAQGQSLGALVAPQRAAAQQNLDAIQRAQSGNEQTAGLLDRDFYDPSKTVSMNDRVAMIAEKGQLDEMAGSASARVNGLSPKSLGSLSPQMAGLLFSPQFHAYAQGDTVTQGTVAGGMSTTAGQPKYRPATQSEVQGLYGADAPEDKVKQVVGQFNYNTETHRLEHISGVSPRLVSPASKEEFKKAFGSTADDEDIGLYQRTWPGGEYKLAMGTDPRAHQGETERMVNYQIQHKDDFGKPGMEKVTAKMKMYDDILSTAQVLPGQNSAQNVRGRTQSLSAVGLQPGRPDYSVSKPLTDAELTGYTAAMSKLDASTEARKFLGMTGPIEGRARAWLGEHGIASDDWAKLEPLFAPFRTGEKDLFPRPGPQVERLIQGMLPKPGLSEAQNAARMDWIDRTTIRSVQARAQNDLNAGKAVPPMILDWLDANGVPRESMQPGKGEVKNTPGLSKMVPILLTKDNLQEIKAADDVWVEDPTDGKIAHYRKGKRVAD